jgi:hypothetical protein
MAPDELVSVRSHFAAPSDELAAPACRRVRSLEDAAHVQQQLAELAARPFVAVAHVINYAEPRLTLKPNARHREWIPGVLDAILAIYDADDDDPICQIRVTVRNDVTDAPIRVRLRSDTREQLKHRLGEHWRSRAARELPRISSFLELPAPPRGRPTEG